MMRKNLVMLFFVVLCSPATALSFDDAGYCEGMQKLQMKVNADSGAMLDAYTRNDGVSVLCNTKVVEFKKSLLTNSTDLREGWQERKASQWDKIYCEMPALEAIKSGWTIGFSLVTKDGVRFWHKAECKG
ncbi:MAG: hypothetical protein K2X09_05425 [Rickettsiales bacterium]|nr:hypothetical protein [Rickettsiales bacterium]